MDTAFITGMGAFISGLVVFVGSAFLLLTLILGARLAYFITASIALAFTLIMCVVWSINPLGPVGQLPEWDPIAADEDSTALEFDQASSYPDDPWAVPNEDDQIQLTQASELESDATKYLETQIADGEIEGFPSTPQFTVTEDSTRLLQQGEALFGMTQIDVLPPAELPELGIPPKTEREAELERQQEALELEAIGQLTVVAEYDPGDPLGLARQMAVGTFILFVLHLFGLSRAERKAKRAAEDAGNGRES